MVERRKQVVRRSAIGALLAVAATSASALADAAVTQYMYCWAQPAKVRYLTTMFDTTGNPADVRSAWQLYLEGKHLDTPQKNCDAGVSAESVKSMRDLHYDMAASIGAQIADVDWTYAPGQVAASDPGKLYYYCHSGTSVAGVSFLSDVFGLPATPGYSAADGPETPFFQFVRHKYDKPPGLAAGQPGSPNNRWCEFSGNVSEAERSKKAWEDELRAQSRKIVETGWKYGDAPATPATGGVAQAVPAAAPIAAQPPTALSAAPKAAQVDAAKADWTYFCSSASAPAKFTYFTRVLPLEGDERDVREAWAKWQSLDHTPGVVETHGQAFCVIGRYAASQYDGYRKGAETNARAYPALGWRVIDVDWRYTSDQVAIESKPGAEYGYCWAQPDQKTRYLSAAFEIPADYLYDADQVIYGEFVKTLAKSKAVTVRPTGSCVRQGRATAAEQARQEDAEVARATGMQVVETGWTFVRTAQTPPPNQQTGH